MNGFQEKTNQRSVHPAKLLGGIKKELYEIQVLEGVRKRKPIQFFINKNGCHVCVSHIYQKGYPYIKINGRSRSMVRYLWVRFNGDIGENLCVCHKCDNPSCINLDHLFLGTSQENTKDRDLKNRQARNVGERAGGVKLTEQQVIKILNSSLRTKTLSEIYKVSPGTIGCIKRGETWKHLGKYRTVKYVQRKPRRK